MNIPTAQYHAKTLQGFEELVFDELKLHGATDIVKGRRGVNFTATAEAMYRHCMHARFTLRVLRTLHTFSAKNTDELYRLSARFAWENDQNRRRRRYHRHNCRHRRHLRHHQRIVCLLAP